MIQEFIPDNIPKYFYYRFIAMFYFLIEWIFPPRDIHYTEIPIIINNFNRLGMLKELIGSLEVRGYRNIYIIDNRSTYLPLLEYYRSCNYPVIYLRKNMGMNALWESGLYKKFKNNFFVYTDPDVVPIDECPDDFLLFFLEKLKKHKLARKVGFSLKIDDLPDSNCLRNDIINCEKHFFDHLTEESLYRAPIATTFALYRPRGKRKHANNNIEMYRTAYPYMARHLPWYSDSKNPDEENRYYLEHLGFSTWWTTRDKEFLHNIEA